ncbi:HtaA domain-containing protein [Kitasatospora sp. NPDC059811]|uniref:HtaA domain-containing protein n=1 Tax=Streptomycetaceae TaxID=2062 RepID=UPI0007AF2464|nr:HtaA domain-containing protein [Streptomyces sp. MJM8645]
MSRNRTRLAALAAATAGLGLTALGAPALAFGAGGPGSVTYDTGALDWGVKASFRSYVSGPASQGGAIELTGGATTNADGTFHFGLANATYDLATHALSSSFTGGVRFTAHHGALDVALSDLKVTTAGTTGTLTADTASKESMGATEVTRRDDVPLVTFTVGRDTTTGVPTAAKLTEQGAKAFAGFYTAGTDMDPLSLLLKQSPATPSPTATATATASPTAPTPTSTPTATGTPTASPSATGTPSATPTATPSATTTPSATQSPSATASPSASATPSATGTPAPTGAPGRLPVLNGTLDWKVKESFRAYLATPMASGKVEFGGGAADYRFGGATGGYNTADHSLTAAFDGSVRFLGHPGKDGWALDTTLSKLGLTIDQGGAFLTADVNGKSPDGKATSLSGARIAKLDVPASALKPVNGVVTLSGVPATLTAEGVPVFSNYPAGTALDPVSATLAFDKDAKLPATPPTAGSGAGAGTGGANQPAGGQGSGTGTVGGASLTTGGGLTGAGAAGGAGGVLAATGSQTPVVPLLATAAGLLLVGGSATVLVRTRRGARS